MESLQRNRPAKVLFVEDNPGDVRLTQQAFEDGGVFDLHVVSDGEKALNFLNRQGEFSNAALPDLILLDLNLPKKDGRQVLKEIKEDPALRSIPVIILTTSSAKDDIARCYNLYANCYITKPTGLTQFNEVIKTMEKFWLSIVRLPTIVR